MTPVKVKDAKLIYNTLTYLDSRYPVNPTSLADFDSNRIVELYDYIIPVFVYDTESGVKKIEITTNDVKWIHTDSILQRFNFDLKGYSYACPSNRDVDKELNSLSIKYYDGNNNCFEWSGTFISAKNTGTYDYVIANGRDKTSVLVASDAPTFVHTLITKHQLADGTTAMSEVMRK